jgi:hypothetical protein
MLIERQFEPSKQRSDASDVDNVMLVMAGGLERTQMGCCAQLKANGFRPRRTRGTSSGFGVRESGATHPTARPIRGCPGSDMGTHAG